MFLAIFAGTIPRAAEQAIPSDDTARQLHTITGGYAQWISHNASLVEKSCPTFVVGNFLSANARVLDVLRDAQGAHAVWQVAAKLYRSSGSSDELGALMQSARLGVEVGDLENGSDEAQAAAALAHRLGATRMEADANYILTKGLRLRGDINGALDAASRAAAAAEQVGDTVLQARALTELATLTKNKGDYIPGLQYEIQALRVELNGADASAQAETLSKLAKLYEQIEDNTQALHSIERARVLAESGTSHQSLMHVLISYANILNDLAPEENRRTLDFANRALDFAMQTGNRTIEVDARLQVARAEFYAGDLDGADRAFTTTLDVARQIGQSQSVAHVLLRQGELYEKRGRLADAISDSRQAIAIYRTSENLPRLIKSYAILERQLDASGDRAAARDARLQRFELRDRVLGASAMRGLAQIESERAQESQKQEIALLKQQGEIDALRLERGSLMRILVIGVAGFLALALGLTALRFRRSLRTNSVLHEKNQEILSQQHALKAVNAELKQTARSLFEAMSTDALTGASSRKYGLELLAEGVANALARDEDYGVLLIDVDHFKQINDRFGHLCGDSVLSRMAAHLRSRLREGDVLVRFGGEEFLVLLPKTETAQACEIAENLRRFVEELRHESLAQKSVTVSIGVCTLAQIGRSGMEALIDGADRALYVAKAAGRNRVTNYIDVELAALD